MICLSYTSTEEITDLVPKCLVILARIKYMYQERIQGGGGGGGGDRRPPRIGKNMIFWRKIVIFHTTYPKQFCTSLRNWKKK